MNSVFKWANCFNSVSDQEYSGPYQGKNLNSELAYPGFIPVPQFNPYAAQQQHPKFYNNGWSYFFGYPSLINPAAAPSQRQFDGDEETFDNGLPPEVDLDPSQSQAPLSKATPVMSHVKQRKTGI